MQNKPKYCIDASALIQAFRIDYPPGSFPTLWKKLGEAANSNLIIAPKLVLEELDAHEDELLEWAKAHERMFIPEDEEITLLAQEVVGVFPQLVDEDAEREQADPFIVALAKLRGVAVVTNELLVKVDPKTKKRKIPNACDHYKVHHMRLIQMITSEGWKF